MGKLEFNEKELEIVEISKAFKGASVPVFNYPMNVRDEWRQTMLEHKPVWMNTGAEVFNFYPDIIPDNRARGFVNDGGIVLKDEDKGGFDMFGIEWVYVPVAGGSMEKPGNPLLFEDANEWEDKIVWPDVDSWDWEGCSKRNKNFLDNGKFNSVVFLNGFGFERLISFMGFENAAMALLDEEQEDALMRLFDKTSDLYVKIVDKCCQYFDIDGFYIHDDWGTQRASFFSVGVAKKFLVPGMKKVTDFIHSKGKVAELHSCGCNEMQIENYIEGGWDMWAPMANINDTQKLYKEYGDKIIIGVCPDDYDENASEAEIRQKAREFVDEFSVPGKVSVINRYFAPKLKGVYAEEVYKYSRLKYLENS